MIRQLAFDKPHKSALQTLIIIARSTSTSFMEYDRANDGIAMNIEMIPGNMVQRISFVVP
ncbi:hypothetical protein NMG60_11017224 [Bertholletia excelsa]